MKWWDLIACVITLRSSSSSSCALLCLRAAQATGSNVAGDAGLAAPAANQWTAGCGFHATTSTTATGATVAGCMWTRGRKSAVLSCSSSSRSRVNQIVFLSLSFSLYLSFVCKVSCLFNIRQTSNQLKALLSVRNPDVFINSNWLLLVPFLFLLLSHCVSVFTFASSYYLLSNHCPLLLMFAWIFASTTLIKSNGASFSSFVSGNNNNNTAFDKETSINLMISVSGSKRKGKHAIAAAAVFKFGALTVQCSELLEKNVRCEAHTLRSSFNARNLSPHEDRFDSMIFIVVLCCCCCCCCSCPSSLSSLVRHQNKPRLIYLKHDRLTNVFTIELNAL